MPSRILLNLTLLLVLSLSTCATAAEETIAWKPLVIPKALVVVGPWGDQFRWREAMHSQGILYDDGYRLQNGYHNPAVRLVGVPDNVQQLANYSVIVLANVDAPALGPQRLQALRQFVKQGGGLVVLGGAWAYSRGEYNGTSLEELLPVTFPPQHRIPEIEHGQPLAAGTKSQWGLNVAFDRQARAYYVQDLRPKTNATVEVTAGEQPVFVSVGFEQGRVVACGLTVHGSATDADSVPFWDWQDWPKVLGHAVEWAAANRPLQPREQSADTRRPLTEDEVQQVRLEFQPVNDEFLARFAAFPTASAGSAVLERWLGGKDFKAKWTPDAIDALARFAQVDWQEPLKKRADGGNPDREQRAIALELLGATKAPTAAKTLLEALGDNDVAPAAIDGLRRLGDQTHVPTLRTLLDRTIELSDFRNPDHQKATGPAAARNGVLAVRAAIALYSLGESEATSRLVALYREIRFMRRVHANASKRRVAETDPTGIAIRKAIIDRHDDLLQLEADLLRFAGPVPPSQRTAFIQVALTATDDADVRWLASALLKSTAAGADWSALAPASDGIVRRLAQTKSR